MSKKMWIGILVILLAVMFCGPLEGKSKKKQVRGQEGISKIKEETILETDFHDKEEVLTLIKDHLPKRNFSKWRAPDLSQSVIIFLKHGFNKKRMIATSTRKEIKRLEKKIEEAKSALPEKPEIQNKIDAWKIEIKKLNGRINAFKGKRGKRKKAIEENDYSVLEAERKRLELTNEKIAKIIFLIEEEISKLQSGGVDRKLRVKKILELVKFKQLWMMSATQKQTELKSINSKMALLKSIEEEISKLQSEDANRRLLVKKRLELVKFKQLAIMSTDEKQTELKNVKDKMALLKKEYFYLDDRIEEEDRIETYVLHKENGKWSNYINSTRNVLVVLLGGEKDLAHSEIKVENKKSGFWKSLSTAYKLAKKILAPTKTDAKSAKSELEVKREITCRFIELNPRAIKPPSDITIKPKSSKEEFTFKIHKKNWVLFRVGVASVNLRKLRYKIEDNQLKFDLEEKEKTEWKTNLFVMLNFHFPRDNDRFNNYGWFAKERFGLFVGAKLSTDPLEKLYLGGSYSISRDFDLIAGVSWQARPQESQTTIGDINSVKDALAYVDRAYNKPRFFAGVAFSPSFIGELLGIK